MGYRDACITLFNKGKRTYKDVEKVCPRCCDVHVTLLNQTILSEVSDFVTRTYKCEDCNLEFTDRLMLKYDGCMVKMNDKEVRYDAPGWNEEYN